MAENQQSKQEKKLPKSASQFATLVKGIIGNNYDVVIQEIKTVKDNAVVVYIEGLTNKDLIDRDIIYPLKSEKYDGKVYDSIKAACTKEKEIKEIISSVLGGFVAVFYEGAEYVLLIEFRQWDKRAVSLPTAEKVTRGPKEGFTENIQTNTALLRRKLKTSNLVLESMYMGEQSNTSIIIVYLSDIVNEKVLKDVKKRLKKVNVDAILDSGQIEQLIEEKPFSMVSGIGLTQKPDTLASRILEGRVGIMVDGTPHVLTIPELFIESIHNSEDFYNRTMFATFMRLLRLLALVITIFLPGLSVAIFTFSPEMIPFVFLSTFTAATEQTPLPIAMELFFLILMFELLKESGIRLPQSIGASITIVGALIIGQAAVDAGIVSAPSVIIVALTSVAGLLSINLNEFATIYRFVFLFLGSTFGLIGIGAGLIFVSIHLISTDSFGVPILSSFSKEEMKDSLARAPIKSIVYRPISLTKRNIVRKRIKSAGEEDD